MVAQALRQSQRQRGEAQDAVHKAAALAKPLKEIGAVGEKVEQVATKLLHAIHEESIDTLAKFDMAVLAAYNENGWNVSAGRPKAGENRRAVPHTVRTYVWEVRSAYRAGVEVWNIPTMYELRMAKLAKKNADDGTGADGNVQPLAQPEQLTGVRLSSPNAFNGAIAHDVAVLVAHLKPRKRAEFCAKLHRLHVQYRKLVDLPDLTEAPAEE